MSGPPWSSCPLLVSLGISLWGTWMPRGPPGECVCLQMSLVPGGCLGAVHRSQGPLETQREGCQGSQLLSLGDAELRRSQSWQDLLCEVAGWRQPPSVELANMPGATSSALRGTCAVLCVPDVHVSRRVQACASLWTAPAGWLYLPPLSPFLLPRGCRDPAGHHIRGSGGQGIATRAPAGCSPWCSET